MFQICNKNLSTQIEKQQKQTQEIQQIQKSQKQSMKNSLQSYTQIKLLKLNNKLKNGKSIQERYIVLGGIARKNGDVFLKNNANQKLMEIYI